MDFARIVAIEYYYLMEQYERNLPFSMIQDDGSAIVHPSFREASLTYATKLKTIMRKCFGINSFSKHFDLATVSFDLLREMYLELPERPLSEMSIKV